MNRKPNPVILAGALLAVVGVVVLVMLASKGDSNASGKTTKVLVASTAIAVGTPSAGAGLVVKSLPASAVPAGAITNPSLLTGQVALRAIAKGEVVLPGAFGVQGVAATGGVVLPPGKEGLGVELAFAPGGLRYVVPGNKITVWATPKVTGGAAVTRVILQDVLVIATTPGAGTGASTAVTAGPGTLDFLLAVSRSQAAQVIAAQASGSSLYFTLANPKQGS